jgi:Putative prokaryotic signal transducing protein
MMIACLAIVCGLVLDRAGGFVTASWDCEKDQAAASLRIDAVAEELAVKEILRTNDAVLVSAVEALLAGAHIPYLVLDQNMSVLEGSLGILPRRVLVEEDCLNSARRLLEDAGLARELRSDVG